MLTIFLLVVGFLLLIKGADFLVDGSAAFAKKFSVSEIVIGLTIVAFGTSSPELIVNVISSISGNTEIAFGNVVGSNIVNILLILGIAGIVNVITIQENTVWREIPFSLLAVIVLLVMSNDYFFDSSPNLISRAEGILLLLFFIIFLTYTFAISKISIEDKPDIKKLGSLTITFFIIGGLAGLIIGGQLVVDNAVILAQKFGLSQKLIGLTIVSIGTSLPELFTSIVAAIKKKSDIAIGNIVGSNIFNLLFVLGISTVINPIPFAVTLNIDLLVLILASLVLFLTMFTGVRHALERWEAVILLLLYIGYNIFIILRG
jgi:cation:H+ antiporter